MSIEPGRELDALVAEKVMGFRVDQYKYVVDTGKITTTLPCYSENISAAWEVVEKITYPDGRLTAAFQLSRWSLYTAIFCFEKTGGGQFNFEGVAPTAPRAICLAALKAVGAIE